MKLTRDQKIEIGKTCLEAYVNGATYTNLEDTLFFGEYYMTETLKSYIKMYIASESIENPQNEAILQYQEKTRRNVQAKADSLSLSKILSLNLDEFTEYYQGLSDSKKYYQRKILRENKDKNSAYADIIQSFIDATAKDAERRIVESRKKLTEDSEKSISEIIKNYLNSDYIFPPELMTVNRGINHLNHFNKVMKQVAEDTEMTKYSPEFHALCEEFARERFIREESVKDLIKDIAFKIQFGIEDENGNSRKFTILDYYRMTHYSMDELISVSKRMYYQQRLDLNCGHILQQFRAYTLAGDHKVDKERIVKYSYSENGRVLFNDEIDDIIAYLNDNNIPLTLCTYKEAYHEYVTGRLPISKKWIKYNI